MFTNILRADIYRLARSQFVRVTAVAFLVVIGLYCVFNFADHSETSFAFGGVVGTAADGTPLIDGFVGFSYLDPDNPRFWELVYSATCFTAATLFAIPITGMMITSADDQNGITKIAVAQGQSQSLLYLSKVVLSVLVTGALWALHNVITLLLTLSRENASFNGDQLRRWALTCLLIFLPLVVLMLLVSLVTLVTGSRVTGLVVMVLLIFTAPFLATLAQSRPSTLLDVILGVNPVWHANRVTRYWSQTQILGHTWLMFVVGSVLLLGASIAWLRRRELS